MVWQQDGFAVLRKEDSLSQGRDRNRLKCRTLQNSHAAGERKYAWVKEAINSRQSLSCRRRLRRCQYMLKHLTRLGVSEDVCPLRTSVRTLNDNGAQQRLKIAQRVSHGMWLKDGWFHQLAGWKKK